MVLAAFIPQFGPVRSPSGLGSSAIPSRLALATDDMVKAPLAAPSGPAEPGVGSRPRLVDMRAELSYLQSSQLPSGAFLRRPTDTAIVPYWGNYATIGLASLAAADPVSAEMGWRWLGWYARQQDPLTGFVTDFEVAGGVERSLGTHDSTDAYAGTFLMAVDAMWAATRCGPCLEELRKATGLAVTAISATQDADGLTWAQPLGHVKYLMDQAEVAGGLRAAERLAAALADSALAARVLAMRRAHDGGVRSLFRQDGTIVWAMAESPSVAREFELPSELVLVDESRLYPDALAPIFVTALAPDLVPERNSTIVDRYFRWWPRWSEDPDIWGFPVLVGWALDNTSGRAEAERGIQELHQRVVDGYRGQALTSIVHSGRVVVVGGSGFNMRA